MNDCYRTETTRRFPYGWTVKLVDCSSEPTVLVWSLHANTLRELHKAYAIVAKLRTVKLKGKKR